MWTSIATAVLIISGIALAAEVARTWYSLIESRAQLELLDEQVETNRKGLISQETALQYASNPGEFELKLRGISSGV